MLAVYRVIIYNKNMTQPKDIRRQVEQKLGHRLNDAIWGLLEELGHVADFGVDEPEPIEVLRPGDDIIAKTVKQMIR